MSEFSEYEMPEVVAAEPRSTGRVWAGAVVLPIVLVALAAFGLREHTGKLAASLNTTRSQIDALTAKINAL